MRFIIACALFLSCLTGYGQYYSITCDSQNPTEQFVIDSVFSGNTPYLRSYHYDNGVAIDLTSWTMEFVYSYGQFDTNGVVQIPGVVSATNCVSYLGATNVFFKDYDKYYFSIKGTHSSGYVKTFATGRMIQRYDPATATNLVTMMGAININWWSNNVGLAVSSNTARIAVFETGKVDRVAFDGTNLIFEGRIAANATATNTLNARVGTAETDITNLEGATNALNTRAGSLESATNTMTTRIIAGEDATNAIQVQVTALQGATGTLNTATNTLQSQITTLKTSTNNLQTQATALLAATNSLQGKITALNTSTGAQQVAIAALQGSTNVLNTRAEALETATNAMTARILATEAGTNALNTRMTAAETATNYLSGQVTALKTATNNLQIQATAAIAASNALNVSVTALKGATNNLNSRVGIVEGWGNHADAGYITSTTNIFNGLYSANRSVLGANISGLTQGTYTGSLTSVSYTGVTALVLGKTYAWGFTKANAFGTSTLSIASYSLTKTASGAISNYFTFIGTDTNLVLKLDGDGSSKADVSGLYVMQITNGDINAAGDMNIGGVMRLDGVVMANPASHIAATGTNVHGLGTMSTEAASDYVATNNTTYTDTVVKAATAYSVANGLNSRSNIWDGTSSRSSAWDAAKSVVDGLNTRSSAWDTAASVASGLNGRSSTWDAAASIADGLNGRSSAWDKAATDGAVATNNIVLASNYFETAKLNTNDAAYNNLLTNTATLAQGALADTALQPAATNGLASTNYVASLNYVTATITNGLASTNWVAGRGYLSDLSGWSGTEATQQVYWTKLTAPYLTNLVLSGTGIEPDITGVYTQITDVGEYRAWHNDNGYYVWFDFDNINLGRISTNVAALYCGSVWGGPESVNYPVGTYTPYNDMSNPVLSTGIITVAYSYPHDTWQAGYNATQDCWQVKRNGVVLQSSYADSNLLGTIYGYGAGITGVVVDLPITNDLIAATNALNTRMGAAETATGTLNTAVGNLNTATGTLNTAVTALNTATGTLNSAVTDLKTATNAINTVANAAVPKTETNGWIVSSHADLEAATNALNTRAGDLETATNAINTIANAALPLTGGEMTGGLTNVVYIAGNGAGLTNLVAPDATNALALGNIAAADWVATTNNLQTLKLDKSATNSLTVTALAVTGQSPTNGATLISTNMAGQTKWSGPVAFRANMAANFVFTNNTVRTVTWSAEEYDIGNNFNLTTFIAPVSGIYSFSICVSIQKDTGTDMGNTINGTININGSATATIRAHVDNHDVNWASGIQGTAILNLTNGSPVTFAIAGPGGHTNSILGIASWSYWNGALIRELP